MTQSNHPKISFRLPPLGLVLQLFAIILLPLILLLVGITFGSITVHQRAMRTLVGERDERAVRIAGSSLSAQVDARMKEMASIGLLLASNPSQPATTTLSSVGYLLSDFDFGVGIFDPQGKLLSVTINEELWKQWMSDSSSWEVVLNEMSSQTGKLRVYSYPGNAVLLGLISENVDGKFLTVGAFSVDALAKATLADVQPPGGQLSVMLVGANDQILYKDGVLTDQSASHPGIAEALSGQSGTVYVSVGGDEHVTAYTPVTSAGWALITEESWEAVATPTLRASQIAPLVLVPAVLILLLALYLGASQVVKPLHTLESNAASLAWGDFKTIQEPVGGIAEIQHLQKELIHMANKVKEAQRTLHSYIGVITEAQEDERRRLARDLHDDTLQALIALKQRVQLAQLELVSADQPVTQGSSELDEIASLTEQTIENLRRLTRALRPVYLEDLGLVPSLEMLARETGQGMGITVEFQHHGLERRLDASIELALYRMAQEALSNITRHAQATQASMTISFSPETVRLQVQDNGVGFNLPKSPAEYSLNGHYGLLGLQERVELIGATLDIRTSPGKGTQLMVTLPVQPS